MTAIMLIKLFKHTVTDASGAFDMHTIMRLDHVFVKHFIIGRN